MTKKDMKVGTLIQDCHDNIYIIAGEEGFYKESSYPLIKTVKLWCINADIFVYAFKSFLEANYQILSA